MCKMTHQKSEIRKRLFDDNYNSRHGADIVLWHWDVTLRHSSFAVYRYNGARYSQVYTSIVLENNFRSSQLHVSNMNWLEISVKAIVPLSRMPTVGLCCQNQASQAGISNILHSSVFCEMQSPIPTGDNRLRQQSPHRKISESLVAAW